LYRFRKSEFFIPTKESVSCLYSIKNPLGKTFQAKEKNTNKISRQYLLIFSNNQNKDFGGHRKYFYGKGDFRKGKI
jgi:hypothetical protein